MYFCYSISSYLLLFVFCYLATILETCFIGKSFWGVNDLHFYTNFKCSLIDAYSPLALCHLLKQLKSTPYWFRVRQYPVLFNVNLYFFCMLNV